MEKAPALGAGFFFIIIILTRESTCMCSKFLGASFFLLCFKWLYKLLFIEDRYYVHLFQIKENKFTLYQLKAKSLYILTLGFPDGAHLECKPFSPSDTRLPAGRLCTVYKHVKIGCILLCV